jgi:hypothetical protein
MNRPNYDNTTLWQTTELLGGNRLRIGQHDDACLPTRSDCSESPVASRIVHERELTQASRRRKPLLRCMLTKYILLCSERFLDATRKQRSELETSLVWRYEIAMHTLRKSSKGSIKDKQIMLNLYYAALRMRRLCAGQHYDNDNSQCKPRDFGGKLRGARRISRE